MGKVGGYFVRLGPRLRLAPSSTSLGLRLAPIGPVLDFARTPARLRSDSG